LNTVKLKICNQLKKEEELTLFLVGSKYFKTNLNRLIIQTEGVRNASDIEYLHRMRVASRKLLSGLNTFAETIPKRKLKIWNNELLYLAKSLGRARDLDVQCDFLKSYLKSINNDNHKRGIERLILRLKQERSKRQDVVITAVANFYQCKFHSEVNEVFNSKPYRKRLTNKRLHEANFIKKINSIISKKINDVLIFEAKIFNAENVEELHEMRKANKQLRYTFETFEGYYGSKIFGIIKTTKNIQDHLGIIHDCDVWLELIPKFIEKEKRKTIKYFGNAKHFSLLMPGLNHFMRDMKKMRMLEYEKFINLWKEIKASGFWDNISNEIKMITAQ
jgi:CHAD domain-containing protein